MCNVKYLEDRVAFFADSAPSLVTDAISSVTQKLSLAK
jgi:hypothetical protein